MALAGLHILIIHHIGFKELSDAEFVTLLLEGNHAFLRELVAFILSTFLDILLAEELAGKLGFACKMYYLIL